ncbi:hypothetical protein P7K49_003938 [Saguinus oedipus]|uniref:Uncharacterized protein n=1 Tax=Saguinus oedipus TaxID=9490 RepID=A0ABQ9W9G9_SAGOE|nr:hypothetical protein P7K49_003938 [Saguinus oedipus]
MAPSRFLPSPSGLPGSLAIANRRAFHTPGSHREAPPADGSSCADTACPQHRPGVVLVNVEDGKVHRCGLHSRQMPKVALDDHQTVSISLVFVAKLKQRNRRPRDVAGLMHLVT